MLLNYFNELAQIIKNAGIFYIKTFKKFMPLMFGLILIQIVFGILLLYFYRIYGFMSLGIGLKFAFVLGLLIFVLCFFMMFKETFNLASFGFEKENLSNGRIIKSVLILGIFNSIPFLTFLLCIKLSSFMPVVAPYLNLGVNIFTQLFYISMSLSIASIVFWDKESVVFAILKSIKLFFKKILITFPLFLLMFVIKFLMVFVICTVIYAIGIKFEFLNPELINAIHTVVNCYPLYLIIGLYLGIQTEVIKKYEKH